MEFRGVRGFQEDRTDYTVLLAKFQPNLVVHGVRKSIFQHFPVNWHFNVVEMALETLHFVQGLSRTPLLFIPRYLTNLFFENIFQKQNLENRQSENLKFQKNRFTNRSPALCECWSLAQISTEPHGDPKISEHIHGYPFHNHGCPRRSMEIYHLISWRSESAKEGFIWKRCFSYAIGRHRLPEATAGIRSP